MLGEVQERVEFFHSESSFGSESNMSESRYFDFTNQIIADTENVFQTLRKELIPIENQNDQEKVQYVIRRAQILQKDTIPENVTYLKKIEAPANARQQLINSSEKLTKLLNDYQSLKKGTMAYKQFYNNYGKQLGVQNGDFSRKKDVIRIDTDNSDLIKPEYIQINYGSDRQKLKGATPRVFVSQVANNSEKEVIGLREEVYRLKKAIEDERKKYEQELINQKLTSERRMKVYLNSQSTPNEIDKNIREQLRINSQKLTLSLNENSRLQSTIQERDKIIEQLKNDCASLKEQVERLRKTQNNLYEEQDVNNKSYNSEMNEIDDKKNDKRFKNLMQENALLKSQLKVERQKQYRLQTDLTEEQRRELERNRKNLEKKSEELDELYSTFDKQRIENLHLSHSCKANEKMIETLKRENEELKHIVNRKSETEEKPHPVLAISREERVMQVSRINKVQVLQYEGDGVEGYPYYQALSKEFKIRFKRACLKQKQLLYKSNGIQIGVITNFEKPNKVNILIHLTNYSDRKFEKVKVKVMNANQNKIQGDIFDYPVLSANEQVKMPVSITISQYPIGPLILLLEYSSQRKEEIRILLPAHIFKTMIIEQRQESINPANSTKTQVVGQKKIYKDMGDLRQYFQLSKVNNGTIKVSLFNEHTHTLFYLDAVQVKEGIELIFEHKEGNRNITEYFIKTFTFLLGKETTK